jgi:S1-C subfamily serine protease
LVDGNGRVVGINTAMIGHAQGLCFAIGIDTAADVTMRLMRDGRVRRSRLGLSAQTIMLDPRAARRLKRNAATAVQIMEVMAGSPAAKAGIAKGDVLLEFAGEDISTVDDLHRLLTAERADQSQALKVLRSGGFQSFTVYPELDA